MTQEQLESDTWERATRTLTDLCVSLLADNKRLKQDSEMLEMAIALIGEYHPFAPANAAELLLRTYAMKEKK